MTPEGRYVVVYCLMIEGGAETEMYGGRGVVTATGWGEEVGVSED